MRVLIIGAGISGLFIAYELQRRGVEDITIIDSSYPGNGASLRNIGCFRSSFTSPEHVVLMKESIKRWLVLRETFGLDIRQVGYIWIARKEETLDAFRKLVGFHNSHGVPTTIIDSDDVKRKEPYINHHIVAGAMYDPTAGKMDVLDAFTKIYLEVKKRGAKIIPYTYVSGLKVDNYRVRYAITTRGMLEADVYVIAAAEGSREILRSINIDLPVKPMPRHPIVTEAYEEIIRSGLVIDWDTPGSPHITQTTHGSIILARDIYDTPGHSLLSQRYDALYKVVKPLIELYPVLSRVYITRYWMGYYDMTPDHHPVYGPIEPYENLYIAAGFSGHGLMMAPATGLLISDWIIQGKPSIKEALNLTIDRFKYGRLVKELAVVG